jgi:hypothetical protein
MNDMITLNEHSLQALMTSGVGINKTQMRILKETFTKGWKKRLIGKTITKERYDQAMAAKSRKKSVNKATLHPPLPSAPIPKGYKARPDGYYWAGKRLGQAPVDPVTQGHLVGVTYKNNMP